MANRADVHMRLCTLEFTFCHVISPFLLARAGFELS
jgi:hypothetical protein